MVPIFSGYLCWRKRKDLARLPVCSSTAGAVVVVFSLGLLTLGRLGAEYFLQRISLWGMIIGLLLYFVGRAWVRAILFPVVFLLFMIPPPTIIYNELVFPLQLVASSAATGFLHVTNLVPVFREGNLLILPNSTLEVTEACSGIRSLFTLFAFALGYGCLVEPSGMLRSLLCLSTIPAAIVGNAVRLIMTASLAYRFGLGFAEAVPHGFTSGVVLATTSLLLVIVHTIWVWAQRNKLSKANP